MIGLRVLGPSFCHLTLLHLSLQTNSEFFWAGKEKWGVDWPDSPPPQTAKFRLSRLPRAIKRLPDSANLGREGPNQKNESYTPRQPVATFWQHYFLNEGEYHEFSRYRGDCLKLSNPVGRRRGTFSATKRQQGWEPQPTNTGRDRGKQIGVFVRLRIALFIIYLSVKLVGLSYMVRIEKQKYGLFPVNEVYGVRALGWNDFKQHAK